MMKKKSAAPAAATSKLEAKKGAAPAAAKTDPKLAPAKSEAVLGIQPKKNPYHEMMITAEKIKTEKKLETRNVKTDFSFNPKNCTFCIFLVPAKNKKRKKK